MRDLPPVHLDGTPAIDQRGTDVGDAVGEHIRPELVLALRTEAQLEHTEAMELAETVLEDCADTVNAHLEQRGEQ